MSDEEIVKYAKDQRSPEPGEPVCIVRKMKNYKVKICGKYGEYICDENESDICSLECKDLLLKQLHQSKEEEVQQTCDGIPMKNISNRYYILQLENCCLLQICYVGFVLYQQRCSYS